MDMHGRGGRGIVRSRKSIHMMSPDVNDDISTG